MVVSGLSGATWRKSSHSAGSGQCVEVARASGVGWRKSTYSAGQGQCVEAARISESVCVRDSKNRSAGVLAVPPSSWSAFVAELPLE